MVAYTDYTGDARVRREAETLAAHGFHVRFLATRSGPAREFELEGVAVSELREAKYQGKSARAYLGSYLRFLMMASRECARLLRRGELDVVHVHNMPDFLVFAGLVPRLAGCKVVLDVHDSMPETFSVKFSGSPMLRRALTLEERVSTSVAHRVICVNEPQRDVLVARGLPLEKTFVSMNVPDPRIFGEPRPPMAAADASRLNLVYHGTMARRLGVDLLVRAVAELRETVPGVRLHLWGHGDDLDSFRTLARDLSVSDAIEFREQGYPLRQLPERLADMDVGVVGNRRSEAGDLMLPVKLLEYVWLGIPAVVPRLKAIEHYFSDEMVAFYEPDNVSSLSAAIRRLHADVERRRRQAAEAQRFLEDYGWARQGEQLVAMYEDLVGNEVEQGQSV
jgi:glycosyltransferase involved in cell wall biosynthesis